MKPINLLTSIALLLSLDIALAEEINDAPLTPASVLESASDADWRTPDPDKIMVMEIASGRVIFELSEQFAPAHIANLKVLIKQRYFDGLAIIRSQDNYVAQWGDSQAGTDLAKSQGKAKASLEPEFFRAFEGLPFTQIESRDAYANSVGFSGGFTVGTDKQRAWLTHCYGALGAGRGMAANSGNAAELYVVTGHAPRHLDRNVTLLGRVLRGMEHLSSLPRGTGNLGFYETESEHVPIKSIRLGSELTGPEVINLQVLRTDTPTFASYVKSRTYRKNEWFLDEAGKIGVCNVGVPVRETSATGTTD